MDTDTVACEDCKHYDLTEEWCNMWDVAVPEPDDSHCNQYSSGGLGYTHT